VGAVGAEEICEVGEQVHKSSSSVSTTDQPRAPREGFFERDQYEALRRRLSTDLQVAVAMPSRWLSTLRGVAGARRSSPVLLGAR
jgi:hypothetical protein